MLKEVSQRAALVAAKAAMATAQAAEQLLRQQDGCSERTVALGH